MNECVLPNTFTPPVSFNELKANVVDIGNFDLPVNFSSDRTSTPDNRISMLSSGTNTVLSLQTNLPGSGCFIQFANPNGDNDFLIGVSNINENFMSLKQNLKIVDENFVQSIQLNKIAGQGLNISNPNITNYVASNLTAYQEKSYNSISLTGFSTPQTCDLQFSRIGNVVCLTVSNILASTDGSQVSVPASSFQEPFRPSGTIYLSIPLTTENGVNEVGVLEVKNDGSLVFGYTPSSGWGVQPNSGWNKFSVSYHV